MARMRPMLATRGTHVPTGEEWQHEVKWDGMRVLAEVRRGEARLCSRNENDATVSFPELAGSLWTTPCSTARWWPSPTGRRASLRWPSGCTSRGPTAPAAWPSGIPVTLLVFDVLRLGDRDLMEEPLAHADGAP